MLNKYSVMFIANFLVSCLTSATVIAPDDSNTTDSSITNHYNYIESTTKPESQFSTANASLKSTINKRERTLIMLKPDAVQRKLVGKIIERFENKGLNLVGMKLILATEQMVDEHYSQHKNAVFHDKLMDYMTSGPLIVTVWEGANAVQITRNMLGYYQPQFAQPGTIRGDFSLDTTFNVIHGSDSVETANKEINLWFQENEVIP